MLLQVVSNRAIAITYEDIFGDVAKSNGLAQTSREDQLHSLVLEDCSELGKIAHNNEIVDPF